MEIVENKKGFKVIKMNSFELSDKLGGYGICDFCNNAVFNGYYIAVLNRWFCLECYNEWISIAVRYQQDTTIEERNFKRVKGLFK